MRIRFQSTSDRLKLMSWHRRFCKSSPVQAKQFVDSIPCEIEIDSLDYYIYSDGEKQLKDIADFEILPDLPEPQPINSCCFPTCGCEFQPEGFFMTYVRSLRSNIDYCSTMRKSLIFDDVEYSPVIKNN